MTLEQQIQTLIDQAPADSQTVAAVRLIAPVLQRLAQRLRYLRYYILQSSNQCWQVTTLRHQRHPEQEKTVLYAFAHELDAQQAATTTGLIIEQVPIVQLLFQVLTLHSVDSLVFWEVLGDTDKGIEISRQELQQLVQAQLQAKISPAPRVPDNFA